MKRLLYIFALFFLLSACADDRRVVALLDHAETLMDSLPDSAHTLLMEADSLIPRQSEKIRMRHAVLMAEANNKLYLPLPPDTIFQTVVDYYDHHGTPNQQLKAHYLLGCIFRDQGEAPMALQCYEDAVEKADTLSEDCDYMTLYKVYGQMADVFHNQIMPSEEIETLKLYGKFSLKAGNMYEHIRSYEYMASAYSLLGDTTMILSLEKQARKLFIQYGFTQAAAHACTISIHIFLDRGEYGKAKEMMEQYQKCSGLFDADGNIEPGWEQYYDAQGKYYMGTGNLDSAQYYFRKLLNHKNSFDGYRGLMHTNMKKGLADSVIFYAQEYEKSIDTLVTEVHAQATRQALGMYNYSRQQKIAAEKTIESEHRKATIYIIIIVFIIAISILYHLHTRDQNRRKQENSRLNQQLFDLTLLYERSQEELELMEIDRSTFQAQKRQELSELQIQLAQLQKKYDTLQQHEKFEALIQSAISDTIKNRLRSFQPLAEKECKTLTGMFKQNMPMLYSRMTDGHILGTLELRVTILTRMGFRSDDIAILLNISKQSVSNARANVNKKLFSDNSARTLFKNLSHL